MRVAIAFADLAGYTQLTEALGDLHALDVVDRFIANVTATLPDDARVIKTIGDEVMVVGPDPAALAAWALRLGGLMSEPASARGRSLRLRPIPRGRLLRARGQPRLARAGASRAPARCWSRGRSSRRVVPS